MKTLYFFLFFVLFPFYIYSSDWIPIGPDTVQVNGCMSYQKDILLVSDGIMVNEYGNWNKYSYGNLPVWDVIGFSKDTLLLVIGNGSYSDGIYKFDLTNHQFHVVKWCINPHFIKRNSFTGTYYVGNEYGLLKSNDGANWMNVERLNNKDCRAIAIFNNHIIISVASDTAGIIFSNDTGLSWQYSPNMSAALTDFAFDEDSVLYGILPGDSYSSGLWKSYDFGNSWENEFYSMNMNAVSYTASSLFVGWYHSDCGYKGAAIWDICQKKFISLNDGLPNTDIRNISINQFFDCPNITVCTDSGAYCLTEFPIAIHEKSLKPVEFTSANYPNPFNAITVFHFNLPKSSNVNVSIFDLNGRLVQKLVSARLGAGDHIVTWKANQFSSGTYLYEIETDSFIKTGKCVLIK